MSRIASRLSPSPSAASRSITWRRRAPSSWNRSATSTGWSSYVVSSAGSPRRRRTARPPRRSIAGITITTARLPRRTARSSNRSRAPTCLLRVELRGEHVVAPRDGRERAPVLRRPPRPRSRPARTSARSRSAFRPRSLDVGVRASRRPRSSRCAGPSRRRGRREPPGRTPSPASVSSSLRSSSTCMPARRTPACPSDRSSIARSRPAADRADAVTEVADPRDHDRVGVRHLARVAASRGSPRRARAPGTPSGGSRCRSRARRSSATPTASPSCWGSAGTPRGRTRRRAPSRAP